VCQTCLESGIDGNDKLSVLTSGIQDLGFDSSKLYKVKVDLNFTRVQTVSLKKNDSAIEFLALRPTCHNEPKVET
jgi:hypothetical protein